MKKPRNRNICFHCKYFSIEAGGAVWKCDLDKKEIPYKVNGLEPPKKCPYLKEQNQIIYRKMKICAKCDSCVRYNDFRFGDNQKITACQCLVSDNYFVDFEMWRYCEVDKRCLFYAEYLMEEINEGIS